MTDMHATHDTTTASEPMQPAAELRGAGVGRRAVATLVDIAGIVALSIAWVSAFGEPGTCDSALSLSFTFGDEARSVCGGMAGVYFLVVLGYYVAFEKLLGATLGKLLLGLRVRALDGTPVSWGQAVARTLLRIIDGILFYLVAAIAVWASPRNQRVGDMAAKTLVVRTGDLPG